MCQLCQHKQPGETSVLREIFHELELEDHEQYETSAPNAQMPDYRLPWRERRSRQMQRARKQSLLNEAFQHL